MGSRWIPVEEKLPEKNGSYLVTRKLADETFVETEYFGEYGWDHSKDVIAWMPLPEPYGKKYDLTQR